MPGKKITEPCCICGVTKETNRLGRFEGKVYCIKHLFSFDFNFFIDLLGKFDGDIDFALIDCF